MGANGFDVLTGKVADEGGSEPGGCGSPRRGIELKYGWGVDRLRCLGAGRHAEACDCGFGRRRQRGLTAMELVASLGIAALLATLAVPGFAALRRSTGLTATANELVGALHLARSSAGRRGIPAVVCLTADERTCLARASDAAVGWLVFHTEGAGAASAQPAAPASVFHTFHLPPEISVSGTRSAITFWPVARAGSTGTFDLCDRDSKSPGKSIVVSQTGRPRVAAEVPSCVH